MLFGDQTAESGLGCQQRGLGRGLPVHRHHDRVRPVDHGLRGFPQPRPDFDRGSLQRPQRSPGHAAGVGNQDVARQARAWNTVTIASTAVTSGTKYWVALLGKGGALYFRDRSNGTCRSENSAQSL